MARSVGKNEEPAIKHYFFNVYNLFTIPRLNSILANIIISVQQKKEKTLIGTTCIFANELRLLI